MSECIGSIDRQRNRGYERGASVPVCTGRSALRRPACLLGVGGCVTTYIDVRVTDVNVDCCHFKVPCFTITGAPLLFLSATVPLLVRLDARVWVLKRTSLARPSVPIRYVFSFSDDAYTVSPPAPPRNHAMPANARAPPGHAARRSQEREIPRRSFWRCTRSKQCPPPGS